MKKSFFKSIVQNSWLFHGIIQTLFVSISLNLATPYDWPIYRYCIKLPSYLNWPIYGSIWPGGDLPAKNVCFWSRIWCSHNFPVYDIDMKLHTASDHVPKSWKIVLATLSLRLVGFLGLFFDRFFELSIVRGSWSDTVWSFISIG